MWISKLSLPLHRYPCGICIAVFFLCLVPSDILLTFIMVSCAIGKHREDYHVLFDYVRLSNGPIWTCDIFWNSLWLIFALKDHDQESRRGEVAQGLEVGLVRGGVLAGALLWHQAEIIRWNEFFWWTYMLTFLQRYVTGNAKSASEIAVSICGLLRNTWCFSRIGTCEIRWQGMTTNQGPWKLKSNSPT